MGRQRRGTHTEGWFHVMNRGVDHQQIFYADTDRVDFGRLLGVGCKRFGIDVHAYCLMTNHFHLLLHCPTGDLSDFMHDVGSAFTRHVNDRIGRDGPLFRGRFRSVRVDTDAHLLCAVRYIHRNPLEIASVDAVDAYRWSSHRTYLGHRRRPDWMRTDVVLAMFDGDVTAYDQFVLGDDVVAAQLDGTDVISVIELMVDELGDVPPGSGGRVARAVSVLLLDHVPDQVRTKLLSELAFPTDGARRTAVSRARRMAEVDLTVGVIKDRVLRLVA